MSKEVQQQLEAAGIIPVLRARSAKEAMGVVEAMVAGGITVIEVTMTVPGAIDVLKELKRSYGSKLLLGSGTVTDGAECAATIEAGAEFVVSPSLHMDVIAETKERDKVSLPGALTPTEVITAWRAGADFVKVFPCSAMGGASYLKSLKAPFPLSAVGADRRCHAADRSQLSGSRRFGAGCRCGPGQRRSAGGREA